MWASLYLALFALACGATYVYAVQEEAVVFSSAVASASWSLLALTGGNLEVVDGGELVILEAGAVQYLMLGFVLLSFIALIGAIIGWYPTEQQHPEYTPE